MPDTHSPENKGFGQGDPALARWAEEVFRPEDEVLREIRERSIREGLPPIAVGRFDGLHLEVIARAIGALKAVEIGTLAIGKSGAANAALLAIAILSGKRPDLRERLRAWRKKRAEEVLQADKSVSGS